MAALIAAQRDEHRIPHAAGLPGAGGVPVLVLQVERRRRCRRGQRGGQALAAEVRRLFARAPGHLRVAADHRGPARGRVDGQQEHRRRADARAGPGRPAQEEAPGHDPAGQGPLAGAGPGQAGLPRAAGQPQVVRRRHRDPHRRGQALPGLGDGHGLTPGARVRPRRAPRRGSWPTARWPWRWRCAAARCPASSCTPTRAARADSTGRRNTALSEQESRYSSRASAGVFQPSVLRGRLLRAAATAARSSGVWRAEVGALGEVLAQQAVGVLVGAALPGAVRVGEVDGEAGVDAQLGVLGHLGALVPGQRPAQLLGQRGDRRGDRVADRLGAVPGERGPVLGPRSVPWPSIGGRCSSIVNRVAALDQGADR